MTSSERILAGIAEEGEKQYAEIIAAAENQANDTVATAETEANTQANSIMEEAEKRAELVRSSGKSAAALLMRDAALSIRRNLIEQVLTDTVADILSFDDETYFSFLLPLIERGRMQGSGKLLLSAKDLARNTADLEKKLEPLALTISDTPADIEGGFILQYHDIYINGSLSALIREKREELVDSVNSILFS